MEIEKEEIKRKLDFETQVEYSIFYDHNNRIVFEIESHFIRYIQYKNDQYEIGIFDPEHPYKYVKATRYERRKRYVNAYEIMDGMLQMWDAMDQESNNWRKFAKESSERSIKVVEKIEQKMIDLQKELDNLKLNI